jgi:hypothetical protein
LKERDWMIARSTTTGAVLEQMVLPALRRGGYQYAAQVDIGKRFGGGRHVVDVVAADGVGHRYLISLKWQQVAGTAEQKVPFEAICLAEAMRTSSTYHGAYLVLGGEGWKLRTFFIGGGLREHLRYGDLVTITSLEGFIAKANTGKL